MLKRLHADGLGGKGITVNTYASLIGLPIGFLVRCCKQGRIQVARRHPITKQWWIYPPAILVKP